MKIRNEGHQQAEYQKAVDILTSQGKFHISLGLERMNAILALMDNPQNALKYVHVAGTNGKGSVCAMLSSILAQSGLKVGLFASPHVFEYTERIKINGEEIPSADFAEKISKIVDLGDKNGIPLTEFEILTALAFDYFKEQTVDIVILETGLGGRLDATNVIEKPLCSVITRIDFDHTERLGDTLEKIAREKAGIIKNGSPVVVSGHNPGYETIMAAAQSLSAKIYEPEGLQKKFTDAMALKGSYQWENLSVVLKTIDVLRGFGIFVSEDDIISGLAQTYHPCRFEYDKKRNILIDGAHNPDGALVLRKSLEENFPNQSYRFIFGCLKNKDYAQMMKNLFKKGDEIYFYHFDSPNSCAVSDLAEMCKLESKAFRNYEKSEKLTVICGSFYMLKEFLANVTS